MFLEYFLSSKLVESVQLSLYFNGRHCQAKSKVTVRGDGMGSCGGCVGSNGPTPREEGS